MPNELELLNTIYSICRINKLGDVISCNKMNLGFNRVVYNVNDEFIIKICVNPSREKGIIQEIKYFEENNDCYHPKLISFDISKTAIPYFYTIEQKMLGQNLFDIWETLSIEERKLCLYRLVEVLKKIHIPLESTEEGIKNTLNKYDNYLANIVNSNIVSTDKINYLLLLRESLPQYFDNVNFGYIHGDVHFNNIIYSPEGIKLIDFEFYGIAPLDMEFDPINRMVRNPNSLIKKGIQMPVKIEDYFLVMEMIKEEYPEVCSQDYFDERLLIYDCINSLRWIGVYPKHQVYHDVLFEKSKKLIK